MPLYLQRGGERIAYERHDGAGPGIVWVGGFHSDMGGTKALALDAWARRHGRAYLRFDYFGHGQSSGEFRDGTVTRWLDDALAVLDQLTEGPQILVGSSMGGWISLLAARARPERIAGLLLIAPAADFTEMLIWNEMSPEIRREILETGEWLRPSDYGEEPYPITRALIEDGRKHLLLHAPLALDCPVRILQGMRDPDVPWTHAMTLVEQLPADTTITLVKDGDHRLSTPPDLLLIERTLAGLLADAANR